MSTYFDIEALGQMIRAKRTGRGLRDVVTEIGATSPATLSRIERGTLPDIETLMSICDWLGVAPGVFFRDSAAPRQDNAGALEQTILSDPALEPAVAQALVALVKAAYKQLARG